MVTKAQIRKSYKQKRAMLNEESVRVMSEAICAAVENSAWYHEAERVGFYYPLGSEVQLTGLVTKAWAAGKKTCFPRVSGENMEFYEISDFSQLEEGCFHVMEPVEFCAEPVVPELILIPGVVFDGFGNRAGYGKGYYDRYLTAHPDCIRAGIAYRMQVTGQIPAEPQDVRMQYLVTEDGITKIGG